MIIVGGEQSFVESWKTSNKNIFLANCSPVRGELRANSREFAECSPMVRQYSRGKKLANSWRIRGEFVRVCPNMREFAAFALTGDVRLNFYEISTKDDQSCE